MLKNPVWLWCICLLLGFILDYLFWEKTPGISFAILAALTVISGLWLASREKARPARSSLLLILPVVFFAVMSFIRQETFSRALDFWISLGLMALFASTFLGGGYPLYRFWDYIVSTFKLIINLIGQPASQLAETRREYKGSGRRVTPYLRGVMLALPLMLVFTPLLSSADPVFSSRVRIVLEALRIEYLPEYLFRLSYILLAAYMLAGVYLHAITASDDRVWLKPAAPLPFGLGFIEATIALLSVNTLFSAFVAIQFRYFFGGRSNISLEGFTYAEYARRGFSELLVVAFFSLLVFLLLASITRRQTARQRWLFSLLGVWLVAMVSVMQVSAFQRLLLYEQAYGFTRLRMYTHVFIIWLGVLLVGTLLLELFNRIKLFPLAVLLVALGFGASLNVLNVDAAIAHQNLRRAMRGETLDVEYLGSLSTDAVPVMAEIFQELPEGSSLRDDLGGLLTCRAASLEEQAESLAWQSFHLSRSRATAALAGLEPALHEYPVDGVNYGRTVMVKGQARPCPLPWPE